MEELFAKVFNSASRVCISMLSGIVSLFFTTHLWVVIVLSILPYILALCGYTLFWKLNEISKKRQDTRDLKVLITKQNHELAMLKAKKNTHD